MIFLSETYTLQEDTTCNGQIISSGELVVKTHYLSYMQEKPNRYWEQRNQQEVIIFPTRTIVHPCIDVLAVKYVHDITKSF